MRLGRALAVTAIVVVLPGAVLAQSYNDGFEPPFYSANTQLSGQNNWFLPLPASSTPWFVYSYANNPLGITANPNGGSQMAGAIKDTVGLFPRAQRNFDFSQRTRWLVGYDVYVSYSGQAGMNANNIGSFSLQPATAPTQYFIDLFQWVTPSGEVPGNPDDGWRAGWVVTNAAGSDTFLVTFTPPNPFHGLQINRWYRRYVAFDLENGVLVKVGIRDLTTGQLAATRVGPTESFPYWYLVNYNNPSRQNPTAFRLFVGGGTGEATGNILAVDNILITGFNEGDVDLDGCVNNADLLQVLFDFGQQGPFRPADLNSDGSVNNADLLLVLFNFGQGC